MFTFIGHRNKFIAVIKFPLLDVITKVTQNNTGMYTVESEKQTFKIPYNNFDVRFEQAY